jgi:cyclic pyranopterin phosphate synthase
VPVNLPILETPRDGDAGLPPAPHGERRLIDSHGRTIRDLRLSITDRCNFRCVYCMEPDVRFMPVQDLLSVEELARVARVCMSLGVQKLRITGGEPTVHPRLDDILGALGAMRPRDLAMTTNGSRMDDASLARWRTLGLQRLTISIDSIREDRFAAITRARFSAAGVIDAVRRATRAGFRTIKLNAVIVRGVNEDEVLPLAELARDLGVEMRYIEYMPLDSAHAWDTARLVPAREVLERIAARFELIPMGRGGKGPDADTSATAMVYAFADAPTPGARIGVIASVTEPFCGACSRLRVTADGKVRPCLFSLKEYDLRPILRTGGSDADLEKFLIDVTWSKQAGHGISTPEFRQPARPMSAIGG